MIKIGRIIISRLFSTNKTQINKQRIGNKINQRISQQISLKTSQNPLKRRINKEERKEERTSEETIQNINEKINEVTNEKIKEKEEEEKYPEIKPTTVTKWSVITTTTNSVFTINEMEKDIDFISWTSQASKLFRCEASYISPKEFNYQLPSHGVPEYAFVGR